MHALARRTLSAEMDGVTQPLGHHNAHEGAEAEALVEGTVSARFLCLIFSKQCCTLRFLRKPETFPAHHVIAVDHYTYHLWEARTLLKF